MYTLTRDDIKAIRKADTIIPQYSREKVSCIRLLMDDKHMKDGGTVTYPEYVLDVDSRFDLNIPATGPDKYATRIYNPVVYRAYAHASGKYGPGKLFAAFVREGDSIVIEWQGGYGSGYMYDLRCNHPEYAGMTLYKDACIIHVYRGEAEYDIEIDDSMTPNNSAKMIEYRMYQE